MKRADLHAALQKEYRKELPCGVVRVPHSGFENTWFVIPPSPPQKMIIKRSFGKFAQANEILSTLQKQRSGSSLDHLVSSLLVRREAVQSSRMEGTWSTVEAVLTPESAWSDEERKTGLASVYGYAHALESHFDRCRKQGVKSLNVSLVKDLHREIMAYDPDFRGKPGWIRTGSEASALVFIGGALRKENSIFNPPPGNYVDRCLKEVMGWHADGALVEMGDAGMGLSLVMRMALGHAHFEAVHPFMDGNGRVGRMLMTLQMVCAQVLPLYLSGFIESEKDEYYKVLIRAQKKLKYDDLLEFMCEAIIQSHSEFVRTREVLLALPNQWARKTKFRKNSSSERSLEWMLGHPVFTAQQLQEELEVSKPAAHRAVQQLMDAGVIQERSGKAKNRIFAANQVIEILSRPFGSKAS